MTICAPIIRWTPERKLDVLNEIDAQVRTGAQAAAGLIRDFHGITAAEEASWREAFATGGIKALKQPTRRGQDMTDTTTTPTKSRRGFASMDPERRREIARKGGAAVDPANRSFSKDAGLAARAGKAGGSASRGGGRPSGGA